MSRFLFTNTNADGTPSLYSTDGTAAGTYAVNLPDFQGFGNPIGSNPDFVAFDNKVFFIGESSFEGTGMGRQSVIYSSDGTAAGTAGVGLYGGDAPSQIKSLSILNGKLLASGLDNGGPSGTQGGALYASSDGINFAPVEDDVGTDNLTVSNGIGYFAGDINVYNTDSLWRTDGTAAGTVDITPSGVSLHPVNFTPVANGVTLFFNQLSNGFGQLWATSGTAASTHQVISTPIPDTIIIGPGSASTGTRVVFSAIDAAGNRSAWATDGTAAGTEEIRVNGPANAAVRTLWIPTKAATHSNLMAATVSI